MTKHFLRMAAVGLTLLTPLSATSAGLSIDNSIAGLGTEAVIEGLPEGSYELLIVPPVGREVRTPFKVTKASAEVMIPGNQTQHAGLYGAAVSKNGENVLSGVEFEILPDSVDVVGSDVTVEHASIVADGKDEADVTVTLRDRFGNPLPGRPVQLIGSTGSENIYAYEAETDAWGEQHFAVSVQSPGLITLRALDLLSGKIVTNIGEISARDLYGMGGHTYAPPAPAYAPQYQTYPTYQYQGQLIPRSYAQEAFDELHTFEITFDPPVLDENEVAKNVFIKAVDRNGKTVEDYTGTVRIFSPTDPDAMLPGFDSGFSEVTFIAQERGLKRLPLVVSFTREGPQVLRAEDVADPQNPIFGEGTVQVGEGSGVTPGGSIEITSHADGDALSNRALTVTGIGSASTPMEVLINDKTAGSAVSDVDGNFSIEADLPVTIVGAFTLQVKDESGRETSAKLKLNYDATKPVIESVKVTPAEAEEGTEALIVVKTEPKAFEVVVVVNEEEFPLEENEAQPGTYQLLFEVPGPGIYTLSALVRDQAGNEDSQDAPLTVNAEGLPTVQNVKATARANAVDLMWDPIPDMQAYRVYVGQEQDTFEFTLDLSRPGTEATVAGLKPGEEYFFAVTALSDGKESREKSKTVSAVVLGTGLKISPQKDALFIEWTVPETPLSSFLLEYGVKEGTTERYTEKRIMNPSLRAFTLRDLLGGVTYVLKLTPIATTGDPLTDLAAKGEGTPIAGDGFHAAPTDPIPFDEDDFPPPNSYHEGAPRTPDSGIPAVAVWLAGGLGLFAVLLQWHRRRTLKLTAEFLAAVEDRYRENL